MVVRGTPPAVVVLVLSLVLAGAAAAKKPPPPPGDKTPPTAPSNLRITASTATSASLAWDAAKGGSSNWWYCVQRDGLGCVRVDPPQTTVTFSRLWPGTTFNWSVVAIDANGNRSPSSNTVTYTTPPDVTPPTAPTLSVTATWPTRIALSWTASTDETQVSYTLVADGSPFPDGQLGFFAQTVLDLAPSTTHVYKVVARDFFGNTAESNTVTVTTPAKTDFAPPTAPTNLRLSPESSVPEIWLDWDPSTDDADSPSLIAYEVFVNGERADVAIGYTDSIVYCRGEGTNTIAVRAVDTSGNASGFSNEITFC